MTQEQQIDREKAEKFAGQMLDIFKGGCLALMTSVGHRTGLFATLAALPPSTSEQVAEKAGLNERYVREWLGGMVTGGIVDFDPAGKTYRLPPEHAAFLTPAAGPDNFAFFTQYVGLMAGVEDRIVESFRNGGGVSYAEYPTFQAIQREETAAVYDANLINVTLPLVPGLVEKLEQGIEVADVGCGAGYAVCLMGKTFPNSHFTGYDFSEQGIAMGREDARALGLSNVRLEVKDVARLDQNERFDFITAFDAIHDQAEPRRVLGAIHEALKPDGTFLCVDMAASSNLEENLGNPMVPILFTFSVFHCMTVSLAQGGEGLGTAWGEQKAYELFREAGFTDIETKHVEGDLFNNYYVMHK
jgi:ubiquinone/menaquinone biosynthesis C-methylase UbiE